MPKKTLAVFLALHLTAFYPQQVPTFNGKVVAVLDGDTIEVMRSGKAVRLRLNGIDAPEKSQAFGNASKKFTSDRLFDKVVKVLSTGTDRYGRTLADIYVGRDWFNYESVAHGYAWHFKKYSDNSELADAEALARSARLGLWEDKSPTPPWEYRKSKKNEESE